MFFYDLHFSSLRRGWRAPGTGSTANKWLDERTALEREIPPGQYVSLSVTDSGTGMPPDVIARAFDRSSQPSLWAKALAWVFRWYGFFRQSGGQVRIYSEVGKGSTMCLYFPRYVGSLEHVVVTEHEHAERGFGERVLVVDDEPAVKMLIEEVLFERFYKCAPSKRRRSGFWIPVSRLIF